MKRKLILIFLTIISAVCFCVGLSACDLLNDVISGIQDVEQSISGGETDGGSDSGNTEGETDGETGDGSGSSSSSSETGDGSGSSSSGSETGDGSGSSSSGSETDDGSGSSSTDGETDGGSGSGSSGDESGDGSGSGTSGSETGDGSGSGSSDSETGDDSGSSSSGGESDDGSGSSSSGSETDDGSGSSSTGGETGDGSGSSSSGDETGDGSSSGTSRDETGDGSGSGTSGDETGDGSGSGTSGDESGDGSGSGTSGDESGDESGSEDADQGTSGGDEAEEDSGEVTADFTAREGNSTYGYCQLASETNGEGMQSLYYQMYTACEDFITDTSDVTIESDYYIIAGISYGEYSLSLAEAISVWEVFYLENPMYYWLSNSCVYSESNSTIYLTIDGLYASYSDRQVYDAAISAMISAAGAEVANKSTELEKAMAIHDYIISKINYAYQSDGTTPETAIWAHNITGVSSKGAGVCEAYSKTYLALCLINGLDCVITTGTAISSGEAHAWNLVKIDGVWYGVDCTWDDTGDNDDLSYVYFGMNAATINSTRTTGSTTYGMSYLYNLPEVATRGIQLVTLFKGTTNLGTYINVDAAFEAMTDSTADYTIELYFYISDDKVVYTSPSTTVYIYSEYTPAVNSVTINGVYTSLENNSFYVSNLSMTDKLTLRCNLTITNIILTATELNLGEYTLTTGGHYCRLNGTICDSKTTDNISIKSANSNQTVIYAALDISYYYGGATVYGTSVIIDTYYGSDILMVYGNVTIDTYISANETIYYNIYLQDGAALTVNNVVYDSASSKIVYIIFYFDSIATYPSLYMGNVEAKTCLYISGYISTTEAAEPANMDCAIATLGSSDGFANMAIYFGSEVKTSLYSVNEDNQIVYNK